jgi:hypothetical protein
MEPVPVKQQRCASIVVLHEFSGLNSCSSPNSLKPPPRRQDGLRGSQFAADIKQRAQIAVHRAKELQPIEDRMKREPK